MNRELPEPDGYILVPIIPTQKMIDAWSEAIADPYDLEGLTDEEANAVCARMDWAAMIAASRSDVK